MKRVLIFYQLNCYDLRWVALNYSPRYRLIPCPWIFLVYDLSWH